MTDPKAIDISPEAVEGERERMLAELRTYRCPNDGGFDRETGPVGCSLEAQGEHCICHAMFNIINSATIRARGEEKGNG